MLQLIPITCLNAEHPDPSSYHCSELEGLDGLEKISEQSRLLASLEDFQSALNPTGEDGGYGTIILDGCRPEPYVFVELANRRITLADLLEGVGFEGGVISIRDTEDLVSYINSDSYLVGEAQWSLTRDAKQWKVTRDGDLFFQAR